MVHFSTYNKAILYFIHCSSNMHINTLIFIVLFQTLSAGVQSKTNKTYDKVQIQIALLQSLKPYTIAMLAYFSGWSTAICAILHRQYLFHCPHALFIDLHCLHLLSGTHYRHMHYVDGLLQIDNSILPEVKTYL